MEEGCGSCTNRGKVLSRQETSIFIHAAETSGGQWIGTDLDGLHTTEDNYKMKQVGRCVQLFVERVSVAMLPSVCVEEQ